MKNKIIRVQDIEVTISAFDETELYQPYRYG